MASIQVHRVCKLALRPTKAQEQALLRQAGAARFAYNQMLSWVNDQVAANRACREAAIINGSDETAARKLAREQSPVVTNFYGMRKHWNAHKLKWTRCEDGTSWSSEISQQPMDSAIQDLAAGLHAFYDERSRWPRFHGKRNSRPSFRYDEGVFIANRRHLRVSKIGEIRSAEKLTHLMKHLSAGARMGVTTFTQQSGRWFACVSVHYEQEAHVTRRQRKGGAVGVDLGIKVLAQASNGRRWENPRAYKAHLVKIRRQSRVVSRRQRGSGRHKRALRDLRRTHEKVLNLRTDTCHKMTTELVCSHSVIVAEDLCVAGMTRGHKSLHMAVHDAAMGQIRSQLEYKTRWSGTELVLVPRFYPSSKRCSGCGVVKPKLLLSERIYECSTCGLVLDRDLNAARNLLQWHEGQLQPVPPVGRELNARGEGRYMRSSQVALVETRRGVLAVVPTDLGPEVPGSMLVNYDYLPA